MKNTKPNPLKVMSIDMVLEDHYNRAQKLKTLQFKPIIIEGYDSHIIGYSLDKKVLIYDGYAIAKQITDERFFDALEGDFMENENWKMAKMFIEHFQMKYGSINYTAIAKELNINGYKTRNGNYYNPTTVRRLNKFKTNNCSVVLN